MAAVVLPAHRQWVEGEQRIAIGANRSSARLAGPEPRRRVEGQRRRCVPLAPGGLLRRLSRAVSPRRVYLLLLLPLNAPALRRAYVSAIGSPATKCATALR